ncbi:ABC transporter permease subunit [Paenibacillus doosanensis]|uniref:Multiple-sugar transport system permease YteP n=1 Tax=Paenibacillus konkukensis TaxID=2020716 RepID=A0ABY4RHI4_9BACL|nr:MULTISPECIES: ABC transporter permease subunit [Paenibacillus]MCS7461328.1 ABC transporter permease subunit [Paenibacillus doosanensis]UQZ81094.1 putative multiple-sugar transport system permease YteP [Paenibacillus konkukensis]
MIDDTRFPSPLAKAGTIQRESYWRRHAKLYRRDKYLLLMTVPAVLYFLIFHYMPMYGLLMAFKDFSPSRGIWNSPWVGLRWFEEFFGSIHAFRLIKNVLLLNLYNLIWGFPIPIAFALLVNEVRRQAFRRFVQSVSYMPHFISVVVIVGMTVTFLSPNSGIVNAALVKLGLEKINFLSESGWFRTIYIGTDIWASFGYNSILYLAAITAIDPQLYEAAKIDGAGRWKQMVYVTLPGLASTIVILLILQLGRMMSVGFEKIILLYNPATYDVADVISTYVYRIGLVGGEFSFAAAIDLMNAVINFMLIVAFNRLARKWTAISLW